jgi:FkbM family methyltransferase
MSTSSFGSAINYLPDASCQIPNLGEILGTYLGYKCDGIFVEVGAFDGQSVSNSSFVADLGWRGVYIEPVPAFAEACRNRHRGNAKVSVVQCAVGALERLTRLKVGGVLTTADADMAYAYNQIDWARNLQSNVIIEVPQVRLETILRKENIPPRFDLLIVDVEGGEENVFDSFSLSGWRPRMLIVELEDTHPSFRGYPSIVERAKRLRANILKQQYKQIFQNEINTIFWDETDIL